MVRLTPLVACRVLPRLGRTLVTFAFTLACSSSAQFSWTVTNLGPAGSSASNIQATIGSQQGGSATIGGITGAALWSDTAGSFVNLHPSGATVSSVFAISGTQQGGTATIGGVGSAALWSGTAGSFVNLNPSGATGSTINAISGSQQGGSATISGAGVAALWSGTAGSFVNLNPTGATLSAVFSMSGPYEAGYSFISGVSHASLWQGNASSFVDLQPTLAAALGGSAVSSVINGIFFDGSTLYLVGHGLDASSAPTAFLMATPVPEPSTCAALFGLNALGFAVYRRQRRHGRTPLAPRTRVGGDEVSN